MCFNFILFILLILTQILPIVKIAGMKDTGKIVGQSLPGETSNNVNNGLSGEKESGENFVEISLVDWSRQNNVESKKAEEQTKKNKSSSSASEDFYESATSSAEQDAVDTFSKKFKIPPQSPFISQHYDNLINQWDEMFFDKQDPTKWHCPQQTGQSWCENIEFANRALQRYLKYKGYLKDKDTLIGEEGLIFLALKPAFLKTNQMAEMKKVLMKGYLHYHTDAGKKSQTLPDNVPNFDNSKNCKNVIELVEAFKDAKTKLLAANNKKNGRSFTMKNVDLSNRMKKLSKALNRIRYDMFIDNGYCMDCKIPTPQEIKLDVGSKVVKKAKSLFRALNNFGNKIDGKVKESETTKMKSSSKSKETKSGVNTV